MECLKNYIGIARSCSEQSPTSNLFMEDLEGISIKSLASVESGKYLTAQRIIDEKMRVVGNKILDELSNLIGDISIDQSVSEVISHGFKDNFDVNSSGGCGFVIDKKPTVFTNLYLARVYFKSHTAVSDLTLTVTDGYNVKTFSVTAGADEEILVETNYSTTNPSITVSFPADSPSQTVNPYLSDCASFNRFDCNSNACCGYDSKYLRVRATYGVDFSNKFYGIRPDVQLVCDREKMVCLISKRNKMMFLYALGVEIAEEAIASDRINIFTTNNKDWWKERAQIWSAKFNESWDVNSGGIRKMLTTADNSCFTCTGMKMNYGIG